MKNLVFTGKDQDWQNESTTYWFTADDVAGEALAFGIRESGPFNVDLGITRDMILDADGVPGQFRDLELAELVGNREIAEVARDNR